MKQNKEAPRIIGLTGGIGSGKSTVARILKEHFNAKVLIADEIGYLAMKPGESSYKKILSVFGTDILENNREINRKKLADIVFHDDQKLMELNSIIHPYVFDYVQKTIDEVKREKLADYLVIESAILIEAGYEKICDEIWYVAVEDQLREERLMKSRGYTREKIQSIIKKQMADSEYSKYSTKIIYNSGELSEIYKQLELLLV